MASRVPVGVLVALLVATSGCRYLLGGDDAQETPDAAGGDATTDLRCGWGKLLPTPICLDKEPTAPVTVSGVLNTGVLVPPCVAFTGGDGEYCVVAGTDVVIANVELHGSRPLVVIALGKLTVTGIVDAASRRSPLKLGPGANPGSGCSGATNGGRVQGGAGGSFGGLGGVGGYKAGQAGSGGNPGGSVPLPVPAVLRGGCPGQTVPQNGGAGGAGGGAIYLIAGQEIEIGAGMRVNASGAGGGGGQGGADPRGGGGGGSGGIIVLDARTVKLAGSVFADGGGGGEGGAGNLAGEDGGDSDGTQAALGGPYSSAGNQNGGDGGDGSYGSTISGSMGATNGNTDTGGGGGGGAGFLWIRAVTPMMSGTTSPVPRMITY